MSVTIDELQIEIQASANKASAGIDGTRTALERLRTAVKGGAGLTTIAKQFERFSAAINSMSDPSGKISKTVSALAQLQNIGKSNLGSTLNQLKKIPEITAGLDDAKLSEFAAKITQVTAAVRPLAAEMEKVSAGFSRLPANIQRAINTNAKLTSSNYKAQSSFFKLSNIMAKVYVVKRIAGVISDWISESNAYVENVNLFTVAMGEYSDSAKEYAETVSEAMGIDPSAWMRNQGVFMTLATGFGVASDKAALMSKNLTQLGYDLSSFFNISVEDAMQKLQSGISGELEPLRRLGYDLSQAKLQEIALANGITTKVAAMNQAQKSQLRYYAIMTQVTTAQGDMARTLESPANQLRILSAQATQAARALGNIFIPALNAVLPYAIAFLKVLRIVANEIANLFGFSMPEFDYSGVSGLASSGEDAENALSGAAGAAKKLKGMLAGFDEINVITQQNTGGGGGGSSGGLGGDLGLELPEYDFLGDAVNKRVDDLVGGFQKWIPLIEGVGIALLAAFAVNKIARIISALAKLKNGFGGTFGAASKVTTGILGFVAAAALAGTAAYALTINGVDPLLSGFLSFIVVAPLVGVALSAMLGPIGWVIAGIGALVGAFAGVAMAQEEMQKEATLAAFFDGEGVAISAYVDKVKAIADAYTSTVQPILDWNSTVESNKTSIQGVWAEIDVLMTKMNTATAAITDEDIEQLKAAFTELHDKAKEQLDLTASIIVTTLNNAFAQAVLDAGLNVDALIGEVFRLQTGIQGKADEVYTEMMRIADSMKGLDPSSDAFETAQEQLNALAVEYAGLTGTVDLATTTWNNARDSFDASLIDFTKEDEAKAALADITASADAALTALDTAHIASLNAIETLESQAIAAGTYDAQVFTDLRNAVNADYEANKEKITAEFQAISDEIWAGFQTQFDAAFDANLANASLWDKAQAWVMESKGYGTYEECLYSLIYSSTEDSMSGVSDAIENFNTTTSTNAMSKIGENLMGTLSSAIEYNNGLPVSAVGSGLDALISEAETKMEIGSPSRLFDRYGMWDMQGLANGIDANGYLVTDSFKSLLNEMLDLMERFTDKIAAAMNTMMKNFANSMDSMSVSANGTVSYSRVSGASISRFAEGGYPVPGELFMARESGPEMVGTMGGRTAVASNDQIVEGIERAVYRAMSSASGGGGDITVPVYIDGELIETHVTRRQGSKSIRSNGRV